MTTLCMYCSDRCACAELPNDAVCAECSKWIDEEVDAFERQRECAHRWGHNHNYKRVDMPLDAGGLADYRYWRTRACTASDALDFARNPIPF